MTSAATLRRLPGSASLSGLRALACITILGAHAVYWLPGAIDKGDFYKAMDKAPILILALNLTEPAMEMFLCLTGFFAALDLVPKLEGSASIGKSYGSTVMQYVERNLTKAWLFSEEVQYSWALQNARQIGLWACRYWRKRAMRIVPQAYFILTVTQFIVLPIMRSNVLGSEITRIFTTFSPWPLDVCSSRFWANYLFVNNWLDLGGCANYTWSLAIQVQFYLTFPVMLIALQPHRPHFRARVAGACIFVMVVSNILKFRLFGHPSMPVPVPLLGPFTKENLEALKAMGHGHYHGTLPRLMHIFPGVLAALILLNNDLTSWLKRHSRVVAMSAVALFLWTFTFCLFQRVGLDDVNHFLRPHWKFAAGFLVFEGILLPGFVITTILTITIAESSAANTISGLLANRYLLKVADVSYGVYLLNPIALLICYSVFPPSRWFSISAPSNLMFLLTTGMYVATTVLLAYLQAKILP